MKHFVGPMDDIKQVLSEFGVSPIGSAFLISSRSLSLENQRTDYRISVFQRKSY